MGSTKEQIAGQPNNADDEVVIHQILTDLFLCSDPVQDAGETDNRCGAVSRQPGKSVHNKGRVSGIDLTLVDVACQVFRNVAVEHGAQNVVLKVPAVYHPPQFVGNGPDCPVQRVPLQFFLNVCHVSSSFLSLYPVKIFCFIT